MVKDIRQPKSGKLVWVTNGDYMSRNESLYTMWSLTSETAKMLKEWESNGITYIIGKPKSTKTYSSEELEKMGLVGIVRGGFFVVIFH